MLTRYDELMCHQTVTTFDRPGSSAREWTERAWFMAHELTGKFHLAGGLGYYPNRNIMDAFACFTIDGKTQYNVRASRELRPGIDQTRVGPFFWEPVEPLKVARFMLEDNKYGLSYDVKIDGACPPHKEEPQEQLSRGRVKENILRFVQVGKPAGWIKAGGQTFELDKLKCISERDRSWGIRVGGVEQLEAVVQPPERPEGSLFSFGLMKFDNWAASYHIRENWNSKKGAPDVWHFSGGIFYPYGIDKEEVELVSMEHDFKFDTSDPKMRIMKSGRVVLNAADGTKKEITIRPITMSLQKPGGYGYYEPKQWVHGIWKGPSYLDGEKLDLTDPKVMREVWGYLDYGSEFKCGNEVGYGTTELLVNGKYLRYGFQSY